MNLNPEADSMNCAQKVGEKKNKTIMEEVKSMIEVLENHIKQMKEKSKRMQNKKKRNGGPSVHSFT